MPKIKAEAQRDLDRGFSDADLAEVSDNPEWTAEDFANARPFANAFPELSERIRRDDLELFGSSEVVSLRLDPAVISYFKAAGPGWQMRINNVLKKAAGL